MRTTCILFFVLSLSASAYAQTDAVEQVERRVVTVATPAGRQNMIVTRPVGAASRLPAILYLPWMDCASLAIPAEKRHGVQQIMKFLIERSGWVVGRIEKPGIGGSDGVCADTDFDAELAGYRAAFAALAADEWSAPGGLVVAGLSFSGGIAPLVADGRPVRGYLAMSTWVRTWFERLIEFERRRMFEAKTPPAELARRMRLYSELYAAYLNERLTPAQVTARRPALAAVWEGSGTHQYGRPASFFHQLQALNLEDAWSRVSAPTLVIWGDRDLAMHRIDHERLVSLVNGNRPGAATLKVVEGAGHDLAAGGVVPGAVFETITQWLKMLS